MPSKNSAPFCANNRLISRSMFRTILTTIVAAVFLLYSQSLLVMWCLYFVEKHDIVLYFCPEELGSRNPFAGARYVHELCDAQRGKGDGALVLLTIVERSVAYAVALHTPMIQPAVQVLGARSGVIGVPSAGYSTPPWMPPRMG